MSAKKSGKQTMILSARNSNKNEFALFNSKSVSKDTALGKASQQAHRTSEIALNSGSSSALSLVGSSSKLVQHGKYRVTPSALQLS